MKKECIICGEEYDCPDDEDDFEEICVECLRQKRIKDFWNGS